MSLTKLDLAGKNLRIPARESLVIDIPAGDEKIANLFYSVLYSTVYIPERMSSSLRGLDFALIFGHTLVKRNNVNWIVNTTS